MKMNNMDDTQELRTMKEVFDYLSSLKRPTKPTVQGNFIDVVNCSFVFEHPRGDAPISSVKTGVGFIVTAVLVPDPDVPGYVRCYDNQDHFTGAIHLIRRSCDASVQ